MSNKSLFEEMKGLGGVSTFLKNGNSVQDLATKLGVTPTTVRNAATAFAPRSYNKIAGLHDDTICREMADMYLGGKSVAEIAEKYGVSAATIYSWFKRSQDLIGYDVMSKKEQTESYKVHHLKEKGLTQKAISEKTGYSPLKVKRLLGIDPDAFPALWDDDLENCLRGDSYKLVLPNRGTQKYIKAIFRTTTPTILLVFTPEGYYGLDIDEKAALFPRDDTLHKYSKNALDFNSPSKQAVYKLLGGILKSANPRKPFLYAE